MTNGVRDNTRIKEIDVSIVWPLYMLESCTPIFKDCKILDDTKGVILHEFC